MKTEQIPVLEAIPVQIRQLLYNLIGNALKFTKKGVPPIVEVSSRPLPEGEIKGYPSLKSGNLYHEITVKDNGIGFDQKYGEQIFIIFQRLRKSREHKVTGLGLSLIKRIAKNHNGSARAVSGGGMGADTSRRTTGTGYIWGYSIDRHGCPAPISPKRVAPSLRNSR